MGNTMYPGDSTALAATTWSSRFLDQSLIALIHFDLTLFVCGLNSWGTLPTAWFVCRLFKDRAECHEEMVPAWPRAQSHLINSSLYIQEAVQGQSWNHAQSK